MLACPVRVMADIDTLAEQALLRQTRLAESRRAPHDWRPVAVHQTDGAAAVLLLRFKERRAVRGEIRVFERIRGRWNVAFEHNDEWPVRWDRPPPDARHPLAYTTSLRVDTSADGRRLACLAGVADAGVSALRAICAGGARSVPLNRHSGAFVALCDDDRFQLVTMLAGGREVIALAYEPPPDVTSQM